MSAPRFPSLVACVLIVALTGCATVIVPTQVQFASLRPGADLVQILDSRPQRARGYREEGKGDTFKFFADDALRPSPLDMIAARLYESLPDSHRGWPAELRRLDIGFLVSRPSLPTSGGTTISVPSGTPVGAVIAGVALAYGMIVMLTRAGAGETGVAYIEISVGAYQLRTAQTVPVERGGSAGEAVEAALANALDDLAAQARELKTTAGPL